MPTKSVHTRPKTRCRLSSSSSSWRVARKVRSRSVVLTTSTMKSLSSERLAMAIEGDSASRLGLYRAVEYIHELRETRLQLRDGHASGTVRYVEERAAIPVER